MQQHPLPKATAETITVQSQRAIMALLPSAKPWGAPGALQPALARHHKEPATRPIYRPPKLAQSRNSPHSANFAALTLAVFCQWQC